MPSGLNQILPRMRVTSDALRISALVVAGVTTGYFWRAAFEASPSSRPVSAPVNIVEPTPKPPVRSTVKPVSPKPARTRHVAPSPAVVISSRSQPFIVETPSPTVRPTPPRKPTPRPPVPTSPPPAPAPQPGTPTPPVTTPTTPAPTTPASPAKGPVAAATPPPVVTQPPAQPPPPTKGDDDGDDDDGHHGNGGNDGQGKPGWGHGDENHDHSGPKGHGG
jgi:hypothetical protein